MPDKVNYLTVICSTWNIRIIIIVCSTRFTGTINFINPVVIASLVAMWRYSYITLAYYIPSIPFHRSYYIYFILSLQIEVIFQSKFKCPDSNLFTYSPHIQTISTSCIFTLCILTSYILRSDNKDYVN